VEIKELIPKYYCNSLNKMKKTSLEYIKFFFNDLNYTFISFRYTHHSGFFEVTIVQRGVDLCLSKGLV